MELRSFHTIPDHPRTKIVIAATARSGTYFAYKLLRRLGANVRHEGDRRNDANCDVQVSWTAIGLKSCMGAEQIFHQVRDPIKAISSGQILKLGYAAHVIDLDLSDPKPLRAARYWLGWNLLCEKHASRRYRVEQIADDDFYEEWCSWFGVETDFAAREILGTKVNTQEGRYRQLTYDDIAWYDEELAEQIKAKAVEYGYEVP